MVSSERTPGTLIVSLDFELHWGVRDVKTVEQYRENLLGVRRAVPVLLNTFAQYTIHATWATVGFLFFNGRSDLLRVLPADRPQYDDPRLSPYLDLVGIGDDEEKDPFHFGRSLLKQIRSSPNQEIGTHTFSHYYCLEPKQNLAGFRADLAAAKAAAENFGVTLKSIVFPRNQYDTKHLRICAEMGISSYRGNPDSWFYRPRQGREQTRWLRAVRLADSYWNLSSHNAYLLPEPSRKLINLPASRFLRPHNRRVSAANALQHRRIAKGLTYAAQNGLAYHLWWHPHNFGINLDENIRMLCRILDHFDRMREKYGMQSKNMSECTLNLSPVQDHVVIEENRFARPRR